MRRLSRWIMLVGFLLVAVIGVLAVLDNRSLVALHFLNWSTREFSVYWWLLCAFVIGVCVGWLSAGVRIVRTMSGNRRLRRDLDRSQAQLSRPKSDTANV